MHLLLTDRLSCPRCGPEFGLILLADRMEDRRVLDGTLGCPNCRDGFPVRDGFSDLRAPPRGALPEGRAGRPGASDTEACQRLLALLGVAEGPGTLLLIGAEARHAAAFSQSIPGIEVVALDPDMQAWPEAAGVSRMAARPGIPLYSRSLRGVALDGTLGDRWVAEAARVAAPLSRVVVTRASEAVEGLLVQAGLRILAAEAETVVATRSPG